MGQVPVEAVPGGPLAGVCACDVWCDHLEAAGATVLARFAAVSPAAGLPALTDHPFGRGRAMYVAGLMDARFCRDLLRSLVPSDAPVRPAGWGTSGWCRPATGTGPCVSS